MGRERAKNDKAESRLTKPALLKGGHKLELFECDRPQLNDWLKKRATAAMDGRTARTIVVCRGTTKVVGYFSLAAGSVDHESSPGSLRRNSPDPIPVIILARLAVSLEEAGKGIGESLLAEAMKRAVRASNIIGARALIVHALDERAAKYYSERGFLKMSGETYFIPMKTIEGNL